MGFPAVVSLYLCVHSEQSLFSLSIPPGMLMPPRCTGAVPQECPRCVLNFGARSFNARRQREWMLFGFVWNSPPFLFSVERPQSLAQQPAPKFPPIRAWGQPEGPGPTKLPKLLVKPGGKLERLCRSSEHLFRLKLPTTRAVTELNIETNSNQ